MVVKATQGGPAADTLPWQKDRGPAEPVVDGEGGNLPPSLAFKFCPGCARPFFSDLYACGKCIARAVQRPTCNVAYCIDCGIVIRKGSRCWSCGDRYNFLTHGITRLMLRIERLEREAVWRNDDLSEFLSTRRAGPVRVETQPVVHPCVVPTCGHERLHGSRRCARHDANLNGPQPIVWASPTSGPLAVADCVICRIPTVGFFCPYHKERPQMPLVLRRTAFGTVSVECPVCFTRLSGDNETKAWWTYAEHHRRRHPMVALVGVNV